MDVKKGQTYLIKKGYNDFFRGQGNSFVLLVDEGERVVITSDKPEILDEETWVGFRTVEHPVTGIIPVRFLEYHN